MFLLLQDAQMVPLTFSPFGAIPAVELERWLEHADMLLPSDLIQFWQLTGGGDVFESETIFRPTVSSPPNSCFVEDDIEGRNAALTENGKSDNLYVFQEGVFLSAIRLSDQRFVTVTTGGYVVQDSFDSLDEWYIQTLRAEFGEKYGLPPIEI